MESTKEGTLEQSGRPKCDEHCLLGLRKVRKFVMAVHTNGRVWTRIQPEGQGVAVCPITFKPIAKTLTPHETHGATDKLRHSPV